MRQGFDDDGVGASFGLGLAMERQVQLLAAEGQTWNLAPERTHRSQPLTCCINGLTSAASDLTNQAYVMAGGWRSVSSYFSSYFSSRGSSKGNPPGSDPLARPRRTR